MKQTSFPAIICPSLIGRVDENGRQSLRWYGYNDRHIMQETLQYFIVDASTLSSFIIHLVRWPNKYYKTEILDTLTQSWDKELDQIWNSPNNLGCWQERLNDNLDLPPTFFMAALDPSRLLMLTIQDNKLHLSKSINLNYRASGKFDLYCVGNELFVSSTNPYITSVYDAITLQELRQFQLPDSDYYNIFPVFSEDMLTFLLSQPMYAMKFIDITTPTQLEGKEEEGKSEKVYMVLAMENYETNAQRMRESCTINNYNHGYFSNIAGSSRTTYREQFICVNSLNHLTRCQVQEGRFLGMANPKQAIEFYDNTVFIRHINQLNAVEPLTLVNWQQRNLQPRFLRHGLDDSLWLFCEESKYSVWALPLQYENCFENMVKVLHEDSGHDTFDHLLAFSYNAHAQLIPEPFQFVDMTELKKLAPIESGQGLFVDIKELTKSLLDTPMDGLAISKQHPYSLHQFKDITFELIKPWISDPYTLAAAVPSLRKAVMKSISNECTNWGSFRCRHAMLLIYALNDNKTNGLSSDRVAKKLQTLVTWTLRWSRSKTIWRTLLDGLHQKKSKGKDEEMLLDRLETFSKNLDKL